MRPQSPAMTTAMGQHIQHGAQGMQSLGSAAVTYDTGYPQQRGYTPGGQQIHAPNYGSFGAVPPYNTYGNAVPSGYTAPQPAAMADGQPRCEDHTTYYAAADSHLISVAYDVQGTAYMLAPNGEIVQVEPSQLAAYTVRNQIALSSPPRALIRCLAM